jgi:hypothetical protein
LTAFPQLSGASALRALNATLRRCGVGLDLAGPGAPDAALRRTTLDGHRLAALAAAPPAPAPAPPPAARLRLFAVRVAGPAPRWAGPARPAVLEERAEEWGDSESGPPGPEFGGGGVG